MWQHWNAPGLASPWASTLARPFQAAFLLLQLSLCSPLKFDLRASSMGNGPLFQSAFPRQTVSQRQGQASFLFPWLTDPGLRALSSKATPLGTCYAMLSGLYLILRCWEIKLE